MGFGHMLCPAYRSPGLGRSVNRKGLESIWNKNSGQQESRISYQMCKRNSKFI